MHVHFREREVISVLGYTVPIIDPHTFPLCTGFSMWTLKLSYRSTLQQTRTQGTDAEEPVIPTGDPFPAELPTPDPDPSSGAEPSFDGPIVVGQNRNYFLDSLPTQTQLDANGVQQEGYYPPAQTSQEQQRQQHSGEITPRSQSPSSEEEEASSTGVRSPSAIGREGSVALIGLDLGRTFPVLHFFNADGMRVVRERLEPARTISFQIGADRGCWCSDRIRV